MTGPDSSLDGGETDRRALLRERLAHTARLRGFPDDPALLDRLLDWLAVVLEQDARVNLTAARTLEEAVEVLAVSALAVARAVTRPPALVVDLGTGNGLPGVAAALAWPDARVLLVERRQKKAAAVAEGLRWLGLGLGRVEVVACDGRELLRERPDVRARCDLVTVRAVGALDEAARIAAPWLAPGGRIAHWKGRNLGDDERAAGRRAAKRLGLRVLPLLSFDDDAGPGHLVLYERPATA